MRKDLDNVYLALEKRGYKIHEVDQLDIEYALSLFCKEGETTERKSKLDDDVMTPEQVEAFYAVAR